MRLQRRSEHRLPRPFSTGTGIALWVIVGLSALLYPACRQEPQPDPRFESPQGIISLLSDMTNRYLIPNSDSCNTLVAQTLAAFDRCTTATLADSVMVNYEASWYYFFAHLDEKSGLHRRLAYDLAMRNPVAADSVRREMQVLRLCLLVGNRPPDSAYTILAQALRADSVDPSASRAVVGALYNLGYREFESLNYDAAASFFRQVPRVDDPNLKEERLLVIGSLAHMSQIHTLRSEYAMAESLGLEACKMSEETFGVNHEITAQGLNMLSELYTRNGHQYESINMSRRAIAILESLPIEKQDGLIRAYHVLGSAYYMFGLNELAEECFHKEAALDSTQGGSLAGALYFPLMGLGSVRESQCRFDEAESLYVQALIIARQQWGPNARQVGDDYVRLCELYLGTKRPMEGEQMLQRANDTYDRSGETIADWTARKQLALARVAALQGRHDEAMALIRKASAGFAAAKEPDYFSDRMLLRSGAEIFRVAREYDSSLSYCNRLVALQRHFVERSFPFLTEGQRLQWLGTGSLVQSGLISMALHLQKPRFLEAAFDMTANAKGRAIDAAMAERKIALCTNEVQARSMLDEYLRVSTRLANISYARMSQLTQNAPTDTITLLTRRRDSLEVGLSQVCFKSGGVLTQPDVSSSSVTGRLGHGAVLWDIVRYCQSDTATARFSRTCFCDEHYAVFVCDSSGVRAVHDVGPAAEIDSMVVALRSAIDADIDQVLSPLGGRTEARIRGLAAQITRRFPALPVPDSSTPGTLYISPDGLLGLLPFELLTLDGNRYLIDCYRIGYLTSSRDIVNSASGMLSEQRAVIFAAPAFDRPGDTVGPLVQMTDPTRGSQATAGKDLAACFGSGFVSLPQSAKEARSVAALLRTYHIPVTVQTGQAATESSLRSFTQSPSILHFATHGFFCDRPEAADPAVLHSPLLRSGIALAGANRTLRGAANPAQDDGILTAYEVSAMDLSGTDLVVLSACKTGAGDVARSEGVLGLTRAFRQAGARSVVMNLWQLSDKVAGELVPEFYRLWLGGESKADALRDAMLQAKERARQRYGHTHPYLWCGFVLAGSPQ